MANAWITLVKKTFSEGLKKDKSYSYKQAMMDAKLKKNGSKKGGQADDDTMDISTTTPINDGATDVSTTTTIDEESSGSSPTVGGKSRRSKKSKKGGKTSKKSKKAGKKSKKTRKARK
jgi:hypothetical protein